MPSSVASFSISFGHCVENLKESDTFSEDGRIFLWMRRKHTRAGCDNFGGGNTPRLSSTN